MCLINSANAANGDNQWDETIKKIRKDLGSMIRLNRSTITRQLKKLIARQHCAENKRGHLIYHGRAISTIQQYSGLGINQIYHGLMKNRRQLPERRKELLRIVA